MPNANWYRHLNAEIHLCQANHQICYSHADVGLSQLERNWSHLSSQMCIWM